MQASDVGVPDVSVITVTRGRPRLLQRALTTVAAQSGGLSVEHIVVVDDCAETWVLSEQPNQAGSTNWLLADRGPTDRDGVARVARLRNQAVEQARGRWVAFIDDDNEWAPDHLSTLASCAAHHTVPASHSHMSIHWRDGRPYLDERFPWVRGDEAQRRAYRELVALGVMSPGSHISRDRMDPPGVEPPARTVDMGEWLLSRPLIAEVRLREDYSADEVYSGVGEDDKLMDDLLALGVPVACTGLPSLRYHLGGFSNSLGDTPAR
jgi:glycosyltransferase involved in cell wall biosynthesis